MTGRMSEVRASIDYMMSDRGIQDYKIDVAGTASKGDGYLGDITFVKVRGSRCNSLLVEEFDVVVKAAKKSAEFRKQTPVKEAYDNEIYVYTKIWPVFQKFQKEKCVRNPFNNIPRCFSVCTDDEREAVILQNLKALNYELWDRQKPMNLNHVRKILTQYGKWHALSLGLKHEKPDKFRELTKDMQDVFGRFIGLGRMVPHFKTCFNRTLQLLEEEGRKDIVAKYDGFVDNIDYYLTGFTDADDPLAVILHGDCWTNNFMFKYKTTDKMNPIDVCMLDLQLSRVASPIFDLSYYLYVVCDKTILDDFDFLLKTYHASLIDYLAELGFNGEEIFPREQLWEQWKHYGKYGLALVPFVIRISLSDTGEAPDFAKAAEGGDGFSSVFNFEIRLEEQYSRRIKDIYIHFAENFL